MRTSSYEDTRPHLVSSYEDACPHMRTSSYEDTRWEMGFHLVSSYETDPKITLRILQNPNFLDYKCTCMVKNIIVKWQNNWTIISYGGH